MSTKNKPDIIRVNGAFDHKLHHAFVSDAQKQALERSGFTFATAIVENSRYYSIVATRMPDPGFEPIIQNILNDPEMPTTLTFRYAYTNPQGLASGYGGGYCRITKKEVQWGDVDVMPIIVDTLKLVTKEPHLSDRAKRAIDKAMDKIDYPSELASLSSRMQVIGVTM